MVAALIFLLAGVVAAFGQEANPATPVIIKYVNENNSPDGYYFEYETSDGTVRSERGTLMNKGTAQEAMVVTGSVSYVGTDNKRYSFTFVADQNGYRPVWILPA